MEDLNTVFRIKLTYYIFYIHKQPYRPRQRRTPLGKMEQIAQ